jgi:ubiquinone/menaquinone biosynthesis C-methylase UbiE
MSGVTKHDAWSAGDSYDAYMGRWSKKLATPFLDWLKPGSNLDWLDVGCGTGSLSSAILTRCNPRSLIGVDQSAGFVATAERPQQGYGGFSARAEFCAGHVKSTF